MTRRLWFNEPAWQALGLTLDQIAFLRRLAEFLALVDAQSETAGDVADAGVAITALQAAMTQAQADIDALEAAGPYVEQDQTAAWADATGTETRTTFATYAGQTITNPPTQAEVQAIDDHVKVLSERVAALINDLRANDTLA